MFFDVATHYVWWMLALTLIALEVILPGYFLLWVGIAAAITGLLVALAPELSFLLQAIAFALLSFGSCAVYWYGVRPRLQREPPGHEHLNQRGARMIGERYLLIEPIINGRGKAKVGDGQWLVSGPDMPLGATVEVLGVDGTTLQVRPAA